MALMCPTCKAATSLNALTIRGQALDISGSSANSKQMRMVEMDAVWEDRGDSFVIARCQACWAYLVVGHLDYGDWRVFWPQADVAVSDDIPSAIRAAVKEAKLCLSVGAYEASLMMSRTALIRLQRDRKVQSLKGLWEHGELSATLYGQADEVRLWANIVGHADVEPGDVSRDDAEEVIFYLESIMDAVYVQPASLGRRKAKRLELGQ